MLCNTSRTGLPAECHVFTIEPVFPSLLPRSGTVHTATLSFSWRASLVQSTYIRPDSIHIVPAFLPHLCLHKAFFLYPSVVTVLQCTYSTVTVGLLQQWAP